MIEQIKLFSDYKFQVINMTDKEIVYCDSVEMYRAMEGKKVLEINPIEFRKKINPNNYPKFKIKTEDNGTTIFD